MSRAVLAAPATFYVYNTVGSDAGDGSAAAPWLTLQHAWAALQSGYDLAGQQVTLQLNGNVHDSGLQATGSIPGLNSPRQLQVIGAMANPAAVLIRPKAGYCFSAAYGAMFSFGGVMLDTTVADQDQIVAGQWSSLVNLGSVIHLQAGKSIADGFNHVTVGPLGYYEVDGGYKIAGGAQCHISVGDNAAAYFNTNGQPGLIAVEVSGAPRFAAAFAAAFNGGRLNCEAVAFRGAAHGPRYLVKSAGTIDTAGGGQGYFPGNSLIAPASGGQYL